MNIEKVTVFGTGNFGARLAFHIAFNKIDVTVYDKDYGLLEEARTRFREFGTHYQEKFGATTKQIQAAQANIAYSMEITEAAGNAQLIIEAVAEDLKSKKSFYKELRKTAPKNAIFTTTSEKLDPEVLSKASGRSKQFLSLHFPGEFNENNPMEIIALPAARQEVVDAVADFAKSINMQVTIKQLNEQE